MVKIQRVSFKALLCILFILCCIVHASAATVTVDKDNIRNTVDDEAMTAEVYGPVSSSTTITNLVIPDFIDYNGSQIPVTSIRSRAFNNNKNLKGSLTIGDNVQTIEVSAFSDCSGFKGSLTIGNNVQTIGDAAFRDCSGFTGSLTIPDKVQTIGRYAFADCLGFTGSLTIGNSVHTIGEYAFYDCSGLTGSLTIPDSVHTIENWAFWRCSGFNGTLKIGTIVKTIGGAVFSFCSGFTGSLTIPNSVQTIGPNAFSNCTGFTGQLTIGDNVQTIGVLAFSRCSGFTGSLSIPKSVQTIEEGVFSYCSGFTGSLTIPNSVQTIGPNAFGNCTGFTGQLTIGDNVQTIDVLAFFRCTGFTSLFLPASIDAYDCSFSYMPLKEITCKADNPPSIQSTTFSYSTKQTACLYVPSQSVAKYQSANYWKDFNCINSIKVLPTSLAIEPTEITIGIKDTFELDIIILPEEAEDADLIFTSSNIQVANVDEDGIITALSEGKTIITVETENGLTATCEVTVIPVRAEYITLSANNLTLLVCQTDKLTATITPENTSDKTITWKSDNETVATVNADGTVTAVSVGVAKITATCGEATATCKVTVNPILATSISIDGGNIHTLKQTENLQLIATVIPENTTYQEVIWKSSDQGKATVTNSGLVTAIEEGNVEIIATLSYQPQVTASYDITIQKRLLGDANDNGIVNVADVGTISDYIVEKPVYQFCFVNADVITDGRITTADVTATVDIIFNDNPSMVKFAKARKILAVGNNELIVDNFNSGAFSIVDVNLKNPSEFTGLQGSIMVQEGVTIRNVTKGAGAMNHILNYNVTDHGTLEFILYSLQNSSFDEMGSLIELEIQADRNSDDIIVENILASDSAANEYSLSFTGGKNNDIITSIDSIDNANIGIYSNSEGVMILNAQGENVNIFNIAGERIISERVKSNKEFYPLASGMYIVTVKTGTAKLIVK